MRKTFIKTVSAVLLVLGLAAWYPSVAAATLTVESNQKHLKVNYNYNGRVVTLSGLADAGVDLVLTIASEESHQILKEKNKVGGVLWMNTGDVKFEHVPNVYYLLSTEKPEDILGEAELAKNDIGYQALLERANIESSKESDDVKSLFGEFVKYKEASLLYSVSTGGFELSDQGGSQKYSTAVKWPYQIPPGDYQITVRAVKGGKVVEKAMTVVTVERAGIVKRLTDMAQNNGALYGILAIVIALGAGFGVGLIFGKGGGAH
jgi:uncharacterized protein (TIGR02186 family)